MTSLRQIRKNLKLSQEQMAALLHVSRRSYGKYERGECRLSPAARAALSRLLQIPEELPQREEPSLPLPQVSQEERELLKLYRSLDPPGKRYIYQAAVREQSLSEIYLGQRSPFGT